jgi:hypothetical protein
MAAVMMREQLSVLYKFFVCDLWGSWIGAVHSFTYGTPVITNDNIDHGPEIEALKDGNRAFYKYSNLESL